MSLVKNTLIFLIRGYQKGLSPLFLPRCRFYPSCSEYCALCLKHHGLFTALGKSLWRILRCQPFCEGGFDPVTFSSKEHHG